MAPAAMTGCEASRVGLAPERGERRAAGPCDLRARDVGARGRRAEHAHVHHQRPAAERLQLRPQEVGLLALRVECRENGDDLGHGALPAREPQRGELHRLGRHRALDRQALGRRARPEPVTARVIEHELRLLWRLHRGAVGHEDQVLLERAQFLIHRLGALGRLLDGLAGVVALEAALGRARVEAEDVGLRLADEPDAVLLVEGQADRHHVELARESQHLDFVLQRDPRARQHAEQVAVLVHVGDRRPDVRGRVDAHRLQALEDRAHVLERVVRVQARADERVALHRREDVLLGVVERLRGSSRGSARASTWSPCRWRAAGRRKTCSRSPRPRARAAAPRGRCRRSR